MIHWCLTFTHLFRSSLIYSHIHSSTLIYVTSTHLRWMADIHSSSESISWVLHVPHSLIYSDTPSSTLRCLTFTHLQSHDSLISDLHSSILINTMFTWGYVSHSLYNIDISDIYWSTDERLTFTHLLWHPPIYIDMSGIFWCTLICLAFTYLRWYVWHLLIHSDNHRSSMNHERWISGILPWFISNWQMSEMHSSTAYRVLQRVLQCVLQRLLQRMSQCGLQCV